jgi:hypothetical protein
MKFTEKPYMPSFGLQISGVFAVIALGLTLNSVPVHAQDTADQNEADADLVEEVIVSATRRALQNSIDIKRDATGIVDALSIGDIGDIPSLSVGEAIEQITGATGHRFKGSVLDPRPGPVPVSANLQRPRGHHGRSQP